MTLRAGLQSKYDSESTVGLRFRGALIYRATTLPDQHFPIAVLCVEMLDRLRQVSGKTFGIGIGDGLFMWRRENPQPYPSAAGDLFLRHRWAETSRFLQTNGDDDLLLNMKDSR